MSELAKKIIAKEEEEQTGKLDLGKCGLTDLEREVPELFECKWLEELILCNEWWDVKSHTIMKSQNRGANNEITNTVISFSGLPKLKSLKIGGDHYLRPWKIQELRLSANSELRSLHFKVTQIQVYDFLADLKNLTTLNFDFQKIEDISFLKRLNKLEKLELLMFESKDACHIEQIPKLTTLYLIYNSDVKDYSFLKKAANLSSLTLNSNSLENIQFLEDLPNLTSLDLTNNFIEDFSCLQKLTKLEKLRIGNSGYNRTIEIALNNLINLTSLDLSKSSISDYSCLENMPKLTSLNLNNHSIKSTRFLENMTTLTSLDLENIVVLKDYSYLKNLTNLTHINLWGNLIGDIQFLENLTNLTSLILGGNAIQDIHPLKNLTKLTYLNLGSNRIKDIRPIYGLYNLTFLDLSNNQIQDVSPLEKLSKISDLRLSSNRIQDITPLVPLIENGIFVTMKENESGLNLGYNLISKPPSYLVAKGNKAILRYFEEQKKGTIPNNEIKLILVGNSTSGKTSLSRFLRTGEFDSAQSSTHGGDLMKVWKPKGFDLSVNIWDFGGQEYYHATHRLFLGDNAVYALVWDSNTNHHGFQDTDIHYDGQGRVTEKLEHFPYTYWLNNVRYYAPQSLVLMVRNKCDENPNEHYRLKDEEVKRYQLGPGTFEFNISVAGAYRAKQSPKGSEYIQSKQSFEGFESALIGSLQSAAARYTLISYWVHIREEILHISGSKHYLNWSEYEALCRQFDDAPDTELAMIYLRDISGVALHYPNNHILKDRVYINPNWLNQRIYKVLDYKVREQGGSFDFKHARFALQASEKEAGEMIALMKEFELIFEDGQSPGYFIAPQFLPYKPPPSFEANLHFANLSSGLYLRFPDFLPRSVVARLIARLGFHAKPNQYWKFGILFKLGLTSLVECRYEDLPIIEISVQNAAKRDRKSNLKVIFDLLLEILGKEPNLELSTDGQRFINYRELHKSYNIDARKAYTTKGDTINLDIFDFLFDEQKVPKLRLQLTEPEGPEKVLEDLTNANQDAIPLLNKLRTAASNYDLGIIKYEELQLARQQVIVASLHLLDKMDKGQTDS